MKVQNHTFLIVSVLVTIFSTGLSEEPGEKIGFTGPYVLKTDWRSQALCAADFNGDSRTDLAVANNDKSMLEIYLQTDNPEDRFNKEEKVLERHVTDAVSGDFNGDGRPDLIIATNPPGLFVYYQNEEGSFEEPEDLDVEARFLLVNDLNNDTRDDLIVFGDKRIEVMVQTPQDSLKKAGEYFSFFNPGQKPVLADIDGDGTDDVLFGDTSKKDLIIIYPGASEGFPFALLLELPNVRSIAPVRIPLYKETVLATANSRTKGVNVVRLVKEETLEHESPFQNLSLQGFDPELAGGEHLICIGDYDGDGAHDIVITFVKAAKMKVFLSSEKTMSGKVFPTLSNVVAIENLPLEKGRNPGVLVMSRDEGALGLSLIDTKGEMQFPQPFEFEFAPDAFAIADIDAGKDAELIVAGKEEEQPLVVYAAPLTTKVHDLEFKELLTSSDRDEEPTAIKVADLNGDGRPDMLLYFEYAAPALYTQDKAGVFSLSTQESYATRKLLEEVNPRLIRTVDIDKDGTPETIVAKESFVRAITFSTDGTMKVATQWNAKKANARIADYTFGDFDANGKIDICLLDGANGILCTYFQSSGGHFEEKKELKLTSGEFERMVTFKRAPESAQGLVLMGESGLGFLSVADYRLALTSIAHAKTEIKDGYYARVACGNITGDPFDEMLALENTKHVLEFYTLKKESEKPDFFYKFKVFEKEGEAIAEARGYYGQDTSPQPREIIFPDINSDGLCDLALLAHNHIVIYEQTSLAPRKSPDTQ